MATQKENMEVLKNNKQQQKMLNELLPVIDKAIKDNFGAYVKMVQSDVSNFVIKKALADGVIKPEFSAFTEQMNGLLKQVGKDLEKQMMGQFAAIKKEC